MSSFVGSRSSSEMQTMSSWKDIAPFAGSVVAYKTNSCYLGSLKGYVLEDKSLQFGYIEERVSEWSCGERGYHLIRLLKPDELPSNCALIDSQLKSSISMRRASRDEIISITKAILADQAHFEYMRDKNGVTAILNKNLSKL